MLRWWWWGADKQWWARQSWTGATVCYFHICKTTCMAHTAAFQTVKEAHYRGHQSLPVHSAWALTECELLGSSEPFTVFDHQPMLYDTLLAWLQKSGEYKKNIVLHNAKEQSSVHKSVARTFIKTHLLIKKQTSCLWTSPLHVKKAMNSILTKTGGSRAPRTTWAQREDHGAFCLLCTCVFTEFSSCVPTTALCKESTPWERGGSAVGAELHRPPLLLTQCVTTAWTFKPTGIAATPPPSASRLSC